MIPQGQGPCLEDRILLCVLKQGQRRKTCTREVRVSTVVCAGTASKAVGMERDRQDGRGAAGGERGWELDRVRLRSQAEAQ